ncbi:hypothetical protein BWD12_08455 [Leptospira santarosai serovar Bananal]|uniref:Secreted protein n=1 Tax=Leptospira santarosai TaxID=28183 RepID=A0AB73LL36_9LEPT|nr:hypothetical protein BWD12_08455 [Leptospira santarosai serovar Bananal]ONF91624.1 hypothetical protein BWD14_16620 [Leptospira santarosai]
MWMILKSSSKTSAIFTLFRILICNLPVLGQVLKTKFLIAAELLNTRPERNYELYNDRDFQRTKSDLSTQISNLHCNRKFEP